MADGNGFALAGDGLRQVTWDGCDSPLGGCFNASPADAEGRGLALTVERGGAPVDLSGASVYLLWRHRELRRRGCEPFEAGGRGGGQLPGVLAGGDDVRRGHGRRPGDGPPGRRGYLHAALPRARGAGAHGAGGGGDDGYSLFLEALQKLEGADEIIAGAVASAEQAAEVAAGALEDAQGASGAVAAANAAAEAAAQAREQLLAAAERGDFDGEPGTPGRDGTDGRDGAPGADGRDGADGREPGRAGGPDRRGRGGYGHGRTGAPRPPPSGTGPRETRATPGSAARRATPSHTRTSPPSSWKASAAPRATR